jgi:hypothetical protein
MAGRTTAIAVLLGTALGAAGRASDYLEPELVVLFALAAPWLVVGFVTGMAASKPLPGAAAGALALTVSVVVYYALMLLVERHVGAGYALAMTILWGAGAAVCGAVFGALGAGVRGGWPTTAILGGALAGEAMIFLLLRGAEGARGLVLTLELVVGIGVVLLGARARPLAATASAAAMASVFAVADGAARVFMRTKGWGG